MKEFTTNELITRMQNIVNRTLKGYKSDFSDYDLPMIKEIAEKNEKSGFIWIARELGTHFLKVDNEGNYSRDYLDAIRKTWKCRKEYLVTYNGSAWMIKKTF